MEPAKRNVSGIVERLRTKENGGLISIYYHPCEWVHLEFWDGVNFRRGANPPREQWRLPPQRLPEETESAFQRFGQYIDHIRSLPGVRFVTAGDLPLIYPDATHLTGVSQQDLAEIASRLAASGSPGLDALKIGNRAYSPADQFELLAGAVGKLTAGKKLQFPLAAKGILGPDSPPPPVREELGRLDWPAFREAARDAAHFVQSQGRVPSRVFIGTEAVAPSDFLVGLAGVYAAFHRTGKLPVDESVVLGKGVELLSARHIAKDTPGLFGGWVIHKEGFRAPKLLEQARLQAWTLKPALRKE